MGPSSNNNISGHINDTNWHNQVQHPSSNNNSGNISDKKWDNQAPHPSNNNDYGHIYDKNSDNQVRRPSYNQQGYNSNGSNIDAGFSSSYNSIRQNQPPPLRKSMMNRNSYDEYQDMPFNNNVNRSSISNSMPTSYEKNRHQNYDVIPKDFGGMNNRFNQPAIHKNRGGSNSSFLLNSFDNSNSYEATSYNYDKMPRQQSRGGGPMHRGRG
jgi:hypothetical protein